MEHKMEKQMALTEARGKFSEIVNEVMYRGDTYVISKLGKPAVAVVPISLLEQWQRQREKQFAILDEIQAQNRHPEVAEWDEETLLETISDLVHEVRNQTKQDEDAR
jgi:prevent-host-death family protein